MEASNDIMIRISPNEGKITVEEDAQRCLLPEKHHRGRSASVLQRQPADSRRGYHSGFLPLNTISLYQSETVKRFVLWHPSCTPMFRSTIRPIPTSRSLVWYLAFRSIKRGKHPIAGLGWWRMKSRPRRHPCTTIHFPM